MKVTVRRYAVITVLKCKLHQGHSLIPPINPIYFSTFWSSEDLGSFSPPPNRLVPRITQLRRNKIFNRWLIECSRFSDCRYRSCLVLTCDKAHLLYLLINCKHLRTRSCFAKPKNLPIQRIHFKVSKWTEWLAARKNRKRRMPKNMSNYADSIYP